jgi:hypothetical protein
MWLVDCSYNHTRLSWWALSVILTKFIFFMYLSSQLSAFELHNTSVYWVHASVTRTKCMNCLQMSVGRSWSIEFWPCDFSWYISVRGYKWTRWGPSCPARDQTPLRPFKGQADVTRGDQHSCSSIIDFFFGLYPPSCFYIIVMYF